MPIPMDMRVDASTGSVIVAPMADDAAAEWQAFANPPLEDAKARKLAALATRRWRAEQAGTVLDGLPVATDTASQIKVVGAALAAQMDPGYLVQWKTATGFITLDAMTVIGLAQAIRAHVQACFDNEAALSASIDAAEDHDALESIDVEAGWPGI